MAKLDAETVGKEITESIKIEVGETDATINVDSGPYEKHLEIQTGVNPKTLAKVSRITKEYIAIATKATGLAALDTLKEHKKLSTVQSNVGLGALGESHTKVQREGTVTVPTTGTTLTQKGRPSTRVHVNFGNRGQDLSEAYAIILEKAKKLNI
jgi:hypothetical protein